MNNRMITTALTFGILLTPCPLREALNARNTLLAAESVASLPAADFFISPQGNDDWSGELADPEDSDGPFATVARAQEAVRALLATLPQPRSVHVVLRGGTYYLKDALEFGPADSGTPGAPVVYTAAPGEKVIISGGRR